jgi:uncharacterized protein (TIGR02001 family)
VKLRRESRRGKREIQGMKFFKKAFWAAMMAGTAIVGATSTANAETTFSGNVALTSDYVFRGISQSDSDIAIQGGFDASNGIFYGGAWASSIDFGLDGTVEVDLYAGVKPTLGPVTFDLGVIGYFYPGIDDAFNADMVELKAGASFAPVEKVSLGATLFYTPEFTFTTGEPAYYVEGTGSYAVTDKIALSGAVGHQNVDVPNYYLTNGDSYTTWNLGGTLSVYGFGIDLRYFDTDLDTDLLGPSGDSITEERVVLTLKRAL